MTAPKKRSPKAAPKPTQKELDDMRQLADSIDSVEPVRIGGDTPVAERMPIFYLDDREFTMPKEINPARILLFMRDSRNPKIGIGEALLMLTTELVGQEALDLLSADPRVTREHIASIFSIVQRKAFEAMADLSNPARSAAGNS